MHHEESLDMVLDDLAAYLASNDTFVDDLSLSIRLAKKNGKSVLTPALYDAFLIDNPNGWPTNLIAYFEFLRWFASYVPHQSGHEG